MAVLPALHDKRAALGATTKGGSEDEIPTVKSAPYRRLGTCMTCLSF